MDGGENLIPSPQNCSIMGLGYTVNITDLLINEFPNATNSANWDYAKTLTRVTFVVPVALYVVGLVSGLAGIVTMLVKIFSQWGLVSANAVLKFVGTPW